MIDFDNRVWSFGDNSWGQIGDGTGQNANKPKELIMFRDCIVEDIKCGQGHVYLKCNDGGNKHYLWGRNEYNACISESSASFKSPQLLDLKDMDIKDIFLGDNNTKLIVSAK